MPLSRAWLFFPALPLRLKWHAATRLPWWSRARMPRWELRFSDAFPARVSACTPMRTSSAWSWPALKNIIAIAAGICVGLGYGHNTLAALVTRGAAEIARLACAQGARPQTLAGLAGMGDLMLTATGPLSRNRQLGIELARGRSLREILASTRMVAEGVPTTAAAVELSRRCGVEMPITEQMYRVLYEGLPPLEALGALMQRPLREE